MVVACGGAAANIVDDYLENFDPDHLMFDDVALISRGKATATWQEVVKKVKGYRVVVPFAVLGGETGTDMIKDVIMLARDNRCKVVSVFGIPMAFEEIRRDRALKNLSGLVALSDVSLVLDMQKFVDLNLGINQNRDWVQFLKMSDRMVMFAVMSLVRYMDGPFFTTFTNSLYAFVIHNEMFPVDAAMKGWESLWFDRNPQLDDAVIMVGASTSSAEMDDIRDNIVRKYGTLPQIVKRSDPDDSKVIVLKAVRSF